MDLDLGAEQRKRYLEQHWKLGLRSLATVLSIALIGVGAKVINDWNESEGYNDSSDVGAYTSIGFCSVAIVWNCAEFIVLCLRTFRKGGLHPGAHVAVDLILWVGLLMAGVFTLVVGFLAGPNIALAVLLFMNTALHFALFVWACIDTHRRNQKRKDKVLQAAIHMVEEQQRQERTTLPPQYEKLHIPQNVVMVPADQWEQMQIQLGQQRIRQYYGMSPDQSPVSELHSPSSPVPALVAKI